MPANRDELHDELRATIGARRELSRDDEEYLIQGFLDRMDGDLKARVDAQVEARLAGLSSGSRRSAPRKQGAATADGVAKMLMAFVGITVLFPILAAHFVGGSDGGRRVFFILWMLATAMFITAVVAWELARITYQRRAASLKGEKGRAPRQPYNGANARG